MINISTEKFKTAVNKSIKGASNNQLLALTQMIGIKVKENKLYLYTTDGNNKFIVIVNEVKAKDFSITVQADLFAKLINKITSETIEMQIADNVLQIKGNGNYKIPLEIDETGLIDFPEIKFNKGQSTENEIKTSTINAIYNTNKAALAKTFEAPFYTGYYIGDKTISTDEKVICFNENKLPENILINAQTLYLLTLNTKETIKMCKKDNQLYFYNDEMVLCSEELDGKDQYPVNELSEYLTIDFDCMCKVPKTLLENVLGRLELFVSPYDENGVQLKFDVDTVELNSLQNSGQETINYTAQNNAKTFECVVSIQMLKEQLASIQSGTVEIHYGNDNAIKIIAENVVYIISLLITEEE